MLSTNWPLGVLVLAALGVWVWAAWHARRGQPLLGYEGRRPVPWHGRDVAIVFLFLVATFSLCDGGIRQLYHVGLVTDAELPDEVRGVMVAGQSISELCVMVAVIGLLIWRYGADWADLGFGRGHVRRDLRAGLIGFLFITAPVFLLYAMLKPTELHPLIKFAARQPSLLWLIGFCAVVVAPLVEEFFFRVVLQGWLERWEHTGPNDSRLLPWLPAGLIPILISSSLFAFAHAAQWPSPVPLFFLALVLGYLYHQTHRLLPSLLVHALLNGSTFLSLWWAIHTGALGGK